MLKSIIYGLAVLVPNLDGFSCRAFAEPKKEEVEVTSIKFDAEKATFILKTKDGEKTLKIGKDVKLVAANGKARLFSKEGEFLEWPPIKCPPKNSLGLTLVVDGDQLVEMKLTDEAYAFSFEKSKGEKNDVKVKIVERKKK